MRFDSRPTLARSGASAGVDTAAVYAIAYRFGAAADLIDGAVGNHLAWLTFDGATAGRAHTARGDALRHGLDRLVAELTQWSRASSEIAATLRASADRYGESELYAAARIA
jgi:Excreted virulence factor EspC, type VII ESX diderm